MGIRPEHSSCDIDCRQKMFHESINSKLAFDRYTSQ